MGNTLNQGNQSNQSPEKSTVKKSQSSDSISSNISNSSCYFDNFDVIGGGHAVPHSPLAKENSDGRHSVPHSPIAEEISKKNQINTIGAIAPIGAIACDQPQLSASIALSETKLRDAYIKRLNLDYNTCVPITKNNRNRSKNKPKAYI